MQVDYRRFSIEIETKLVKIQNYENCRLRFVVNIFVIECFFLIKL